MTATENEIQRLIECCICCDYLTDVSETPCCHQLFCRSCILSWLQTSTKNCPRCRSTTLSPQTLTKNVIIQRFVDNLEFDCPNKLQGCPARIPRCDLAQHKILCQYSPEKLVNKQRKKLIELEALFQKFTNKAKRGTDRDFYDLAVLFYNEHEYQRARDCLQLIKDKKAIPEMVNLRAKIERDDSHYDQALELYTEAYSLTEAIPERIEILLDKGHIYVKKAQYGLAKDILTQALELSETDDNPERKARILNAIGLVAKKCSEVRMIIFGRKSLLNMINICFLFFSSMNKL